MGFWTKTNCRPYLPLTLLLFLGACQTDGLDALTASISGALSSKVEAESFQIVSLDEQGRENPDRAGETDLRKVLQAAVARLRGHSEARISDALGVSLSGQKEPPDTSLRGFTVAQALVTAAPAASSSAPERAVTGIFDFQDSAERKALIGFSASYRGGETVAIESLDLFHVYAGAPDVTLFVVPAAVLEKFNRATATDYGAFHAAVQKTSLEIHRQSSLPSGSADYAFVAFVKDRLAPGHGVQMSHARSRDAGAGDTGNSFYRAYDDGWVVAILRREVDLRAGNGGWLKVTLFPRPDPAAENKEPLLIGLFHAGPQAPADQQSTNRKN